MTIRTAFAPPPIPSRDCDWSAWDDRYNPDDADYRVGYGATEAEAVADLMQQIKEDET